MTNRAVNAQITSSYCDRFTEITRCTPPEGVTIGLACLCVIAWVTAD